MRKTQYHILFFICYTAFLAPCYGQKDTVQHLQHVLINAFKKGEYFASSVPVQILSDTALQKLNSYSVADALRYFSGVQVKDYGGIGGLKTVNVRNLGANQTGLFYDGVPIGNMQNGQIDLGKFSLDNIEEIKLYNAGNTSMLQPAIAYASGSAIYMKSRQPVFKKGEKIHVKAQFKTGSFGLINPSILWQQKISPHYNLSFNTEKLDANGRYKFRYQTDNGYDTTVRRENTDVHAWRIETALSRHFKDSSQWQTQVYYYHSARGLPGAIVNNKFNSTQRLWDDNFFAQSSFSKRMSKLYQFSVIGKYAYDYTRYYDPETVGDDGALNNIYRAKEWYLSIANQFTLLPFWKVLASVDARFNKLDGNLDNFAFPKRQTLLGLMATELSWTRLSIQGNVLSTYTWDKVVFGPRQPNRKIYSPAVSFSWQPFYTGNIRIRGFYKDIFRMPTFNDLYYTGIGYTNLKPEFAKQYDLGFTYFKAINPTLQYFSMQIDGYYNRVTNKIVALPSANLFRWRIVNLGAVSVKGISTNVKTAWNIASQLNAIIHLQYSYEKSLNKTEGTVYNNPVPYSPINSGSATAQLSYKDWGLNYSFLYTGARYNATDITLSNSYMQPWYTHDLGAKYTWHTHSYTVIFGAEVNNVFNQQYDVIFNYPMPGRNYKLSISLNI